MKTASYAFRTNTDCGVECIALENGNSCMLPFTLRGYTFTGCIEKRAVDTVSNAEGGSYVCPLQYNRSSNEYFGFKTCADIGESCSIVEIPACFDSPCQNGGTCRDTNENAFRYACDCSSATGFIGRNCTSKDPCHPNPCQGGTCSVQPDQNGGFQFSCACPVGTFPPVCDVDPCFPNPCGDGICSSSLLDGAHQVDCQCPKSETIGDFCQNDPCLPNPCYSGTCSPFVRRDGSYGSNCTCSSNSTGEFCEVELCTSSFCDSGKNLASFIWHHSRIFVPTHFSGR